MEKELLEMAAHWKQTAQEMIAKSENGSRSEMVNQMLYACTEVVEWKLLHSPQEVGNSRSDNLVLTR